MPRRDRQRDGHSQMMKRLLRGQRRQRRQCLLNDVFKRAKAQFSNALTIRLIVSSPSENVFLTKSLLHALTVKIQTISSPPSNVHRGNESAVLNQTERAT
jgi:hypothetical protein